MSRCAKYKLVDGASTYVIYGRTIMRQASEHTSSVFTSNVNITVGPIAESIICICNL